MFFMPWSENGRGRTKTKKAKQNFFLNARLGPQGISLAFEKENYFWKRVKISEESNGRIFESMTSISSSNWNFR